ncbi:MAG: FHA domain-containing protein [Verrucomicrobiota bacterium]
MDPLSLKSDSTFSPEDAQTEILSRPINRSLKKETIMLSKPAASATVYIKLPQKLSIEVNVLPNCCLLIGRAPSAPENIPQYTLLALDNSQISRTHVALFMEKETLYIQDMDSSNGTYLTMDGERYTLDPLTATTLADHSVVEFGDAVLNVKPARILT